MMPSFMTGYDTVLWSVVVDHRREGDCGRTVFTEPLRVLSPLNAVQSLLPADVPSVPPLQAERPAATASDQSEYLAGNFPIFKSISMF